MKFRHFMVLFFCCFLAAGNCYGEPTKHKRRKQSGHGKKITAFRQGQIGGQVCAGYLLKTDYSSSDYSLYGTLAYKASIPFYVRAEYGITDFLSAGLYFGFFSEKVTITDVTNPANINGFNHSYTSYGIRAAFHPPLALQKLDPYAGIAAGMTGLKTSPFGNENYITPMPKAGFGYAGYLGLNFYFTDNIGVFVEGGYGKWLPWVNGGIAVKF